MKEVYWLREGKIAGRSGPNLVPWQLEELRESGIASILSVNHGEDCHTTLIERLGFRYDCIPMSRNAPAIPGDKEYNLQKLPQALSFIHEGLDSGPVLIHCRSGKDRTGLVMAAYLIAYEQASARQAMDEVLRVRPIAFSAEGWKDFCFHVLCTLEESIK
jgi:protein-tyrosine phosphatase